MGLVITVCRSAVVCHKLCTLIEDSNVAVILNMIILGLIHYRNGLEYKHIMIS